MFQHNCVLYCSVALFQFFFVFFSHFLLLCFSLTCLPHSALSHEIMRIIFSICVVSSFASCACFNNKCNVFLPLWPFARLFLCLRFFVAFALCPFWAFGFGLAFKRLAFSPKWNATPQWAIVHVAFSFSNVAYIWVCFALTSLRLPLYLSTLEMNKQISPPNTIASWSFRLVARGPLKLIICFFLLACLFASFASLVLCPFLGLWLWVWQAFGF